MLLPLLMRNYCGKQRIMDIRRILVAQHYRHRRQMLDSVLPQRLGPSQVRRDGPCVIRVSGAIAGAS